eukprot:scaffold302565_cov16-Prasinocladus_malaysianus.AAC.1
MTRTCKPQQPMSKRRGIVRAASKRGTQPSPRPAGHRANLIYIRTAESLCYLDSTLLSIDL